jgi:hypothetical protein
MQAMTKTLNKTLKELRLARELEAEKQRRIKAEKEARTLRVAALKWHQHVEPPAGKNVWHP